MGVDDLTRVATAAAEAGAQVALHWHGSTQDRGVREKAGPRDLVSRADVEAEQAIREVIAQHRPHDAIVGEEEGHTAGTGAIEWLVDPIDGTTSYLYGRADWSVSVAARDAGGTLVAAAVAEPLRQRLTWAGRGTGAWIGTERLQVRSPSGLAEALVEVNFGRPADQHPRAGAMVATLLPRVRDLRRGGSAASSLVAVATGEADAAWSPGLQPWDGAAGALLVLEAGGVVGDLAGPSAGRWPEAGDVLAAPPQLWPRLREALDAVYGS